MTERRAVLATYRLQLGPDLDFAAAADLVDYLARLGVSHLYLSPLLQARSGSTHGYDVVDPTRVSDRLGGEDGLRRLAERAQAAGLGLVVDIVPNHLGIGPDNPLWELLLAEGQTGEGGRTFDVDWHPALPLCDGKVLLPVLGDQYGAVLDRGELELRDDGGEVRLRYHEHSFPLSPESSQALARSGGIGALHADARQPGSWQRLHALLEQQHYRLVWWRVGDAVVNYRRFFAINELAAVRVEDEHVFDLTHAKVVELVGEGVVDGLRVDHPDGLRDPGRYFRRLADATGGVWTVAEKITHPGEALPDWPVAGTTGYDFANDVLGLFVDPAAQRRFDDLDRPAGTGSGPGDAGENGEPARRRYATIVRRAKQEVLRADLASDFARLSRLLWALTQEHPESRDVTLEQCRAVLDAVLVAMPVYRTYVDPLDGSASEEDRTVLERAFAAARADASAASDDGEPPAPLWDLAWRLLAGEAGSTPAHLDFLARSQQLSSALMAKGVEDTAFYRYRAMLALNEVGGEPTRFGVDADEFHRANAARAARHPLGLVTTATHDTKRGEDVRLRIAALTEMPERWEHALRRWQARGELEASDAQLVLQTTVGAWPTGESGKTSDVLGERLSAYLVKALREAGESTSWTDPDEQYESRVTTYAAQVLADPGFSAEIDETARAANEIAMVSGLAQVLLRSTSPGVADTYQGNELWDDSLVDPDNRRAVDFARRRTLLDELDADADPAELWEQRLDGRVKLWVLSRALRARHEHREAFGDDGAYLPLAAVGPLAEHVVAYARGTADTAAVVVVAPRLPGAVMGAELRPPLGGVWQGTDVALPDGRWVDVLSGAEHDGGSRSLERVLATLPVALLTRA